ncbi:MAG: response regulator transcription factor [Clostridiales Family XIII bacterium]|jgi:DNA-binding response OmpR family regulator|nr:response regulator transcription factor [Clostridiales Family XIII bacterium]
MSKKILIVDDEKKIRDIIGKFAKFEGYDFDFANDGLSAIEKIRKKNDFDLIILDIMMPNLDGFSTAREIRKLADIPILMLSARGEEYDKLHGFELGIDDYLVKPFSPKELFFRISAILKRINKGLEKIEEKGIHYQYKDLNFDSVSRILSIKNKKIPLSKKEFSLLLYLIENKNIALARERIINAVWDYESFGNDRTLDTHIKTLRKALGEYGSFIITLRGFGYKFEDKK